MKKILSALLITGLFVSNLARFQVNAAELNPEQNSEFKTISSIGINNFSLSNKQSLNKFENTISGQMINNNIKTFEDNDMPSLYVAADSEKPVIDISSIQIYNTTAYVGDIVTFYVKVTDNDIIDSVLIKLRNDVISTDILGTMLYDEKIKMYKYELEINSSTSSGVWYVAGIEAKDKTGNIDSQGFTKDYGLCFDIINSNLDSEKPVIDVSSITMNKKEVNMGENILFRVKVTDNEILSSVNIFLYNNSVSNGKYGEMLYNKETGFYEYLLNIDDSVPEGIWHISGIEAIDIAQNMDSQGFTEDYGLCFNVINPNVDSESPVINRSSLIISNRNAMTGDKIDLQIKISDNIGLNSLVIYLYNCDNNKYYYFDNIEYNKSLDVYECSMIVDDTITVGHWSINVFASDAMGNNSGEVYWGEQYTIMISDHGEDIHKWDEGEIIKYPTIENNGIKRFYCKSSYCDECRDEIIPVIDDINSLIGNTDINVDLDGNKPIHSWWQPTTQEEKIRYACFGKEKVEFITPDNQPFNINIQNAMQGEKCFEVFQNVAGDYTIARTYNIYPIGTQLQYLTPDEITVSLAIPEILLQENREFKMICVSQNGMPYIFEDQDKDPNTITFSTDKFYAFALIYKDKN